MHALPPTQPTTSKPERPAPRAVAVVEGDGYGDDSSAATPLSPSAPATSPTPRDDGSSTGEMVTPLAQQPSDDVRPLSASSQTSGGAAPARRLPPLRARPQDGGRRPPRHSDPGKPSPKPSPTAASTDVPLLGSRGPGSGGATSEWVAPEPSRDELVSHPGSRLTSVTPRHETNVRAQAVWLCVRLCVCVHIAGG